MYFFVNSRPCPSLFHFLHSAHSLFRYSFSRGILSVRLICLSVHLSITLTVLSLHSFIPCLFVCLSVIYSQLPRCFTTTQLGVVIKCWLGILRLCLCFLANFCDYFISIHGHHKNRAIRDPLYTGSTRLFP